jgi:hypothetical protein
MTKGSDDNKTRRLDDDYFKKIASRASSAPSGSDDDKTQIFRPSSTQAQDAPELDLMADPPTGWLVAIDGPGKGTVLTIGIGNNGVGRGDEARISIPFNDNEISRGQSFSVAYDPKHRRYYLLPGSGKTLVYFEEQPVLERMDLETGMSFQVGQTNFRFVALCNEQFDWQQK